MSAYSVTSTALKAIIDTEFAAELVSANHDKLHGSLGTERIEVGISPLRQLPQPGQRNVMETYILVQFYDVYVLAVDPTQQVNPMRITAFADRFMRAVEANQASTGNEVWYFDVDSINYPDDPTGNKSRFEATVRARGDNVAMTERL